MIGKFIRHGPKRALSPHDNGRTVIAQVAYVLNQHSDRLKFSEQMQAATDYILNDGAPAETTDRIRFFGVRNLVGEFPGAWAAEMVAVALQAPTAAAPSEHLVLSWREGEHPTHEQSEAAVSTVADLLEATDLQIVWAAHGDTNHDHIHIVINRVAPSDYKVRALGGGWERDRLHQALALIERKDGWVAEPNAVYNADVTGEVWLNKTGRQVRDKAGRQLTCKGDRAADLALMREDPALSTLHTAITGATDWAGLHQALAKHGVRFERRGSGALITFANKTTIKPSEVARSCGFGALVRRLGDYQPAAGQPAADPDAVEIKRRLKAAIDAIAAARAETRRVLLLQLEAVIADIERGCQSTEHAAVIASAARKEALAAQAVALRDFDRRRDDLRRQLAFDTSGPTAVGINLPTLFLSAEAPRAVATVVNGYRAEPIGTGVAYHRPDAPSAFTDHRWFLTVPSPAADRDLVAAMQLAAARWPVVSVTGSAEQVARSLELARIYRIPVTASCGDRGVENTTVPVASQVTSPSQVNRELWVDVPPGMLPAMRETVQALGFDVGQRGAVRFNRDHGKWRIAAEHLMPDETRRLTAALAPYLTSQESGVLDKPARSTAPEKPQSARPEPKAAHVVELPRTVAPRPTAMPGKGRPRPSSLITRLHQQDAARARAEQAPAAAGHVQTDRSAMER